MKTALAALALALVALAPTAAAQEPTGITLVPSSAGTVPFKGAGEFAYTADIGCAHLVPGGTLDVTVTDPPAWMTVTADSVEVQTGPGCVTGQGRMAVTGAVAFTVSEAAPAVVQHVVHLVATVGDEASEPASATVTVAYNSSYSVVPSLAFPVTLTEDLLTEQGTLTFTATGTQSSNAPSMIMVDGLSACDGASVSGFGALQYNNDGGKPDTKTYNLVFTPPPGEWQSCPITLRVYGHYNFPDGSAAGDPTDRKTITWEVVNGGLKPAGGGEDKKSPAPVAMFIGLGLLGLAALRRRA